MSIEKHDLVHEFPELRERIHVLKTTDHHFARLFNEYHDLDHEVRRIEEGVENTSDAYLETRKKMRLLLKDQLYGMLRNS
ncbi:MAG: YdcH family protein [Pseudohongiellaceae bacterium]